jgi:hypothetical protein
MNFDRRAGFPAVAHPFPIIPFEVPTSVPLVATPMAVLLFLTIKFVETSFAQHAAILEEVRLSRTM